TGTLAPLSSTSRTIPAKVFTCPSRISTPKKVAGVCCARDFRARVADSSSGAKNILPVILSPRCRPLTPLPDVELNKLPISEIFGCDGQHTAITPAGEGQT